MIKALNPDGLTRALVAALITLALALPAAAAPIVLHRANGAEPDSLDPQKVSGTWENNIIGDMFIGLMTEDARGQPTYGSAISYTVSQDGLVYTFKLRPGMTWSDGVAVTADDFVFSFRRILDPKTAAKYASIIYPIKNAQAVNSGKLPPSEVGVRAIDPKTLQITLEEPTPYFIELLTHNTTFPVPRHVVEKYGDQWIKPGNIVVNGPYVLKEWIPNAVIKLVKNPKFYDAANVQIDEVDFLPISDGFVTLNRFRAGEIDVANDFPTREYAKLKSGGYPDIKPDEAHVAPYTATTYVQFNTTRHPFDDPRVRRALSLAIDRKAIADRVLATGQVPAYSLIPPGMAHYDNGPELDFKNWPMDKRLAEARALLGQAGFGPDNPLKFEFRYRDNPDNKRVAIELANDWSQVGAIAQLLSSETKVHYNALRTQDFDVADAGWVADYNDPQNFLFLMESTSGQMNYGKYSNPKYDALMQQAAHTIDLDAREKILKSAEEIVLQDEPIAPVFYSVSRSLVRDYVKGWDDNVLNWHRTRYLRIER
jgi:oligopeptide transport system substrate-binding protein